VTLPNILKKFNPHLTGFSRSGFDLFFLTREGKGLNVAVSGDEANDMPRQVATLIARLRQAKHVDFHNDWKLVNLFIGGNDLCDFCADRALHSPESYIGYVSETACRLSFGSFFSL
jgi:phospholipase B1